MKPLQLVMSAFGPYADKIEVDFTKLGTNGVYLITGDTGAGKTTIFDAIIYALYGEASGSVRDKKMFRSKYAKPTTETFVELIFEYRGKEYKIRRNPEYERPRKKGEGLTTQKAEVELSYPDDRPPVTKETEVKKAIESLIGLDRAQFSQIAMIAQGDFQKLLLAGTEEREKIFQKIFQTGSYQKIQEELKERANELNRDYQEMQRSIKQSMEQIICQEESIEAIEWERLRQNDYQGEVVEALELIRTMIEKDETLIQDLEQDLAQYSKKISETDKELGKAEKEQETKRKLEYYKQEKEAIQPFLQKAMEEVEKAKEALEESQKLDVSIEEGKKKLEQWEKLLECQKEKRRFEEEIEQKKKEQEQLQERQVELQQWIAQAEEKISTLGEEKERKTKLFYYQENCDQWKKKLESLEQQYIHIEQLQKEKQSKYEELTKKREVLYSKLEELRGAVEKLKGIEVEEVKQKSMLESFKEKQELLSQFMLEYRQIQHQLQQITQQLNKDEIQLQKENEQRKQWTEEIEQEQEIEAKLERCSNETMLLGKLEQEVEQLKKAIYAHAKHWNVYCEKQKVYQKEAEELTKMRRQLEGVERTFFDAQAGILASNLKEGDKCPVCGSTHHPELAHMIKKAPTKEELEAERDKVKVKEDQAANASKEAGEIKVTLELSGERIEEQSKMQFDKEWTAHFFESETMDWAFDTEKLKQLWEKVKEKEREIKEKKQSFEREKESLETRKKRKDKLKIKLEEQESRLQQKEEVVAKQQKEVVRKEETSRNLCDGIKKVIDKDLGEDETLFLEKVQEEWKQIVSAIEKEEQQYVRLQQQIRQRDQYNLSIEQEEKEQEELEQQLIHIEKDDNVYRNTKQSMIEQVREEIHTIRNWKELNNVEPIRVIVTEMETEAITEKNSDWRPLIQRLSKGFTHQLIEWKQELERLENGILQKEAVKEEIPNKKESLEQLQQLEKSYSNMLIEKNTQMQSQQEQIKQLEEGLQGTTKEEVTDELEIMYKKKEEAKVTYEQAQQSEKEYHTKMTQINSNIALLEEQQKKGTIFSIEELQVKQTELREKEQERLKVKDEIYIRKENNTGIEKRVKEKQKEIIQLEEQWKCIKSLSDTANGRIAGKERITFETYVQMQYFDRILRRANIRFMEMSGGQYELRRQKQAQNKSTKTGLDLEIYDYYNGTSRSVKTLSGGETFKASLSLALGLADEIQAYSGGIQLDTMFIDEGFGSLDEESLEQAMNVLLRLSEGSRLIGIISHVSELKDRMDKKIEVTKIKGKDGIGSHISIQCL